MCFQLGDVHLESISINKFTFNGCDKMKEKEKKRIRKGEIKILNA